MPREILLSGRRNSNVFLRGPKSRPTNRGVREQVSTERPLREMNSYVAVLDGLASRRIW